MLCNREQMAAILGMSPPTLDDRRRNGLPGEKKGKSWEFDTKKVIEWLVRQGQKGTSTSRKQDVELRIALADAELKDFKVAEQRGTMLHIDDVTPIVEEQFVVIKSKINALPGRLAQKCAVETDPAVVLRLIKEEVAEVLEDISSTKLKDPDQRKRGFRATEDDEADAPEPDPEANPWDDGDL